MNFSSTEQGEKGSYAKLEQSLTAPEEELPTMTATPMIQVVAPATLSEGYKFDAQVGDRTFQVTVPPGGVEGGQRFTVPMPSGNNGGFDNTMMIPKIHVPVGHWKDGICDCLTYGPFHNHCLMAFFCPLPAAGQVITRLKLNMWGKPTTNHNESVGVYQKLFAITLVYLTISFLLNTILRPYNDPINPTTPPPFMFFLQVIYSIIHYAYLGLLICILWNLRFYIRQKYVIPEDETFATGCEDLLCVVCCAHLAVAQMLRHTTDYETYNSTCCTTTGVPAHVPSIV